MDSKNAAGRPGTLADSAESGTGGAAASASGADPLIGRAIGKYVVEKKLGEGGMGAVYRMRHVEIPDTFLALKILTLRAIPGDPVATREMAERFAQEARAASAVGSHRVVQVVDVGQLDDGTRYLMMEYVPGRSVGQAIEQDGAMDVRKALLLCARVADTLAIAHQRGIIHRDIKPMNLMLVDEGDDPMVKILDFGVSRATGEAKIAHTTERKIIGSPGYMAPEAAIGTPVDGRADVFSLAATLFEMLTGQLPFRGATFHALMMATIQEPIPAAGAVRPAHLPPVPEAVEAVLAWGLTKDPAARPMMAEFRAALVEAAEAMAQERRGTGPMLASVMRNFTPSPSERPTLSAGAAEASEILARYGTPQPARGTPQPGRGTPQPARGTPSPSAAGEPTPYPSSSSVSRSHAGEPLDEPAPAAAAPRTNKVVLVSAAVAVMCIAILVVALLWPRPPAPVAGAATPTTASPTATTTSTAPTRPVEPPPPPPPPPVQAALPTEKAPPTAAANTAPTTAETTPPAAGGTAGTPPAASPANSKPSGTRAKSARRKAEDEVMHRYDD